MRVLFCLLLAIPLSAQPKRNVSDPGVITTRQAITPAGMQSVFARRAYGVDFGADSSSIWVLEGGSISRLDWRQNKVLESIPFQGQAGLQGIRFDRVTKRAVFSGAVRQGGNTQVSVLGAIGEGQRADWTLGGVNNAGSPAVAQKPNVQGQRIAVVPLIFNNELAVVDLNQPGATLKKVRLGIAPFAAAIDETGSIAWVTNWGGRVPKDGERTMTVGPDPKADRVVVDARDVAASGTVSRVDLASGTVTHTIETGLHPSGIVWDTQAGRLYIANANSETITVVDTKLNAVAGTFSIQPFTRKVTGIAPNAIALSPDGKTIYVACGGINAVAVLNARTGAMLGMIPTAWYPNSVAASADGKYIAVTTLLGVGSGARGEDPKRRFAHANRGSVSVIPVPDAAQLASYTTAVAENTHMRLGPAEAPERPRPGMKATAIPARAGEPSLIEHVVYIVKENRTYDQILGDLPQGNGDPSLVMYGEDVTPNTHKLAREFVLLDNFYATGGNSADGHNWLTQANEVDYALWPGYQGRSYPYDGSDPLAMSAGGFIWTSALKLGKTVRVFGEYAGAGPSIRVSRQQLLDLWKNGEQFPDLLTHKAPMESLQPVLQTNFPGYNTNIPDVVRARIFLGALKEWETAGKMPNLILLQLPSNHTHGTRAGSSTPKAMVADNDLALGQVVEGLSKSKFWPKMAIFVVEDDAQDGVDHVDGHRTVALAISPYIRRGHVDSTFYANQSMLKTIELILGLPTMSIFDLISPEMRASFTDTPDATPYEAAAAKHDLWETNPRPTALNGPAKKGALDSAKMDFSKPDAAPTQRLNRILWHDAKGWNTPYPKVKSSVFSPLAIDLDDDEREEAKRER
jgi:DNA-binding beta-propeller fold protein YncE